MKIIILLIFVVSTAFAQSSERFFITRGIIAGGGTKASTSSRFQLASTIGQPLAAAPYNSRFSIQSGFWIVPVPILFGPTKVGTNFLVSIQSELGKTYTLQYMNTLGGEWQSLPPLAGNGKVIVVTNRTVGLSQRFFRLVEQ